MSFLVCLTHAKREMVKKRVAYFGDPGHMAGRDSRHAGGVALVLRKPGPVKATALQLESSNLHLGLGSLHPSSPARSKLEAVHRTPYLSTVRKNALIYEIPVHLNFPTQRITKTLFN